MKSQKEIENYIDRAYTAALLHGFHEVKYNKEHLKMLIFTEISEAISADRHGKRCVLAQDLKKLDNTEFKKSFEISQKDTVEDEFADICIRIFDMCYTINLKLDVENYNKKEFNISDDFCENGYNLIHIIDNDDYVNALSYVEQWAKKVGCNDIYPYIDNKMRYNDLRPFRNGKKY